MGVAARIAIVTLLGVWAGPASAGTDPPEFVLQWGSLGSADGQLAGPHGIEVDAAGNVIVADTGNNRIQVFSADGIFLRKWGSVGSAPGQFRHPHGIGVAPDGHIYVAETGNNRVQKFTADGMFVTTWGSFGSGDGQFRHNHGLAVDHRSHVYVADRDQNRVQKFDADGTFLLAWGGPGTGDGQFVGTNGVAVDREGNVFVGDSSPRIQKFNPDGTFLLAWGSGGTGDGEFDFPRGLSTDGMGNLYVADRNLHRMQQFKGDGTFLTKWGSLGNGAGQFNFPYALRADERGFVYVADTSNHRVQKFRIANAVPSCAAAEPTAATLWPPNHKLVPVGIVGVTDADGDALTVTATGVTQDEPVTGLGYGTTRPDAELHGDRILLRAERSGSGNGRVYEIGFSAEDGRGGSCLGTVRVCVPHDRRRPPSCVDDGQLHDSLGEIDPSFRFLGPRSETQGGRRANPHR